MHALPHHIEGNGRDWYTVIKERWLALTIQRVIKNTMKMSLMTWWWRWWVWNGLVLVSKWNHKDPPLLILSTFDLLPEMISKKCLLIYFQFNLVMSEFVLRHEIICSLLPRTKRNCCRPFPRQASVRPPIQVIYINP